MAERSRGDPGRGQTLLFRPTARQSHPSKDNGGDNGKETHALFPVVLSPWTIGTTAWHMKSPTSLLLFLHPLSFLSPHFSSIYPRIHESFHMSRTYQQPLTPSSQASSTPSSKFKEHLAVAVPPPYPPVERSRFSPDSPTERAFSFGGSTLRMFSPRSRPLDLEKGPAGLPASQSPRPSIRDRIAPLFQALRVSRRDDSSVQRDAPIVAPLSSKLPDSQPVDVRKPEGPCTCHVHDPPTSTQKWYNRAFLFAFIVFLLFLFINVVFLNIRVISLSRVATRPSSVAPSASAPMMNTVTLSADTQQCIKEYTLNAPSDPTGYSCDTCLPLVTAVPSNATDVYPVARDASQFCGLRSIWEDAGEQGRAGLEAGGWVKDIRFCTWNGVRCDGAGRVSSL
jgi:hypothetical protein